MVQALKRKEIGLLLAGVAALALSGCADSSRIDDPFSSPFKASASSRYDRAPTGSTLPPAKYAESGEKGFFAETFRTFDDPAPSNEPTVDLRRTPAPRPVATLPVESRPLAPPAPIVSQPLPAPRVAAPAVQPAPIQVAPIQVAPQAAPVAQAPVPRVAARVGGWSSEGGVPVVVAQGETVGAIAHRYGVPVETLLQLNGYRIAAQVQPGARLTIPVYSANGRAEAPRVSPSLIAKTPAAKPRQEEEAAPAPKKPEPRLVMKPGPKSLVQEENEDAAKLAAPVKPVVDPAAERKVKLAEARAAAIKEAALAIAQKKAQEAQAAAEAKKAEKLAQKAQKLQLQQQQQLAAPAEEARPAPKVEKPKVAEAAPETVKPKAVDDAPTARTTPDAESANPEFRWPARGRVIGGYGGAGNDGINIAVPEGTAVKAAEAGEVTYAGSELKGYGNLVLIHHPNGFDSVYANNGALNVKRGDKVKRGQTIALSGQSGNVSSPQLHFELRKGHKPVDPTNFLAGL